MDDCFERPAGFDLAAHWAKQLKRFETDLRPHIAYIRASKEGRRRIAELGEYAAKAVADAQPPDNDDLAELQLPFENVDQGARLLLGIGPEITVTGPPDLREAMRAMAMAAIANLDD